MMRSLDRYSLGAKLAFAPLLAVAVVVVLEAFQVYGLTRVGSVTRLADLDGTVSTALLRSLTVAAVAAVVSVGLLLLLRTSVLGR